MLDGEPIFDKSKKDSEIKDQVQIAVFDGNVPPGIHNLSVYIEYRGHGYGVFTYLNDYVFKLRTTYPFTVEEGKIATLKSVAYEKGNFTTDVRERPALRFSLTSQAASIGGIRAQSNKNKSNQ